MSAGLIRRLDGFCPRGLAPDGRGDAAREARLPHPAVVGGASARSSRSGARREISTSSSDPRAAGSLRAAPGARAFLTALRALIGHRVVTVLASAASSINRIRTSRREWDFVERGGRTLRQ